MENLGTIFSEVSENSEFSTSTSQTGKFHLHTRRKNRRRRGPSGMDLQSRNTFDSSDHVVKIADHLGCLGYGVPTGRKNPRGTKSRIRNSGGVYTVPDSETERCRKCTG